MENERRGWTFNKTMSMGDVVNLVVVLGTVLFAWHTMDIRLSAVELTLTNNASNRAIAVSAQARRDEQQDQEYQRQITDVKETLREIKAILNSMVSRR